MLLIPTFKVKQFKKTHEFRTKGFITLISVYLFSCHLILSFPLASNSPILIAFNQLNVSFFTIFISKYYHCKHQNLCCPFVHLKIHSSHFSQSRKMSKVLIWLYFSFAQKYLKIFVQNLKPTYHLKGHFWCGLPLVITDLCLRRYRIIVYSTVCGTPPSHHALLCCWSLALYWLPVEFLLPLILLAKLYALKFKLSLSALSPFVWKT